MYLECSKDCEANLRVICTDKVSKSEREFDIPGNISLTFGDDKTYTCRCKESAGDSGITFKLGKRNILLIEN